MGRRRPVRRPGSRPHPGLSWRRKPSVEFSGVQPLVAASFSPLAPPRSGIEISAQPWPAAETGLGRPRRAAPKRPRKPLSAGGPLVAARPGGQALGVDLRPGAAGGIAGCGGVGRSAAHLLDALQHPVAAGPGHRGLTPQDHRPPGAADWGGADLAGPEPQLWLDPAGPGAGKGHPAGGCPASPAAPQPGPQYRGDRWRHRALHPAQWAEALQQQSHGHSHGGR